MICAEERMALICFDHILRDERQLPFVRGTKNTDFFLDCFFFPDK